MRIEVDMEVQVKDKSYYIKLLGDMSKTEGHEKIVECLEYYGLSGTYQLSVEQIKEFIEKQKRRVLKRPKIKGFRGQFCQ